MPRMAPTTVRIACSRVAPVASCVSENLAKRSTVAGSGTRRNALRSNFLSLERISFAAPGSGSGSAFFPAGENSQPQLRHSFAFRSWLAGMVWLSLRKDSISRGESVRWSARLSKPCSAGQALA